MALLGPRSRKRKRTGTGTSSTASSSTASRSRTKAMVGRERNSTQPRGRVPSWAKRGHRPLPSPQPPAPGWYQGRPGHRHPPPARLVHVPTRTTVASAFSGIFSSSFSSCLDLERVMPAGGAGGGSSRWGCRTELSPARHPSAYSHRDRTQPCSPRGWLGPEPASAYPFPSPLVPPLAESQEHLR